MNINGRLCSFARRGLYTWIWGGVFLVFVGRNIHKDICFFWWICLFPWGVKKHRYQSMNADSAMI